MPPIHTRVLHLLRHPDYQPLDKAQLAKELNLPSSGERRSLLDALRELQINGHIVALSENRYALPPHANTLTGKLQVHRNGNAHFQPATDGAAEVFLAAADLGTALHGDIVQVRLKKAPVGRPKRHGEKPPREGQIVRVVTRSTDRVVGLVQQNARKQLYVIPDDSRFQRQVMFRPSAARLPQPPRIGDKAVIRLDPWDDPSQDPTGELIEVLGPAHAPGVDMLSVVRKFDLPTEFPREVLAEAEGISETIPPREIALREDLREEMVITIDPDDARDFDDAINVRVIRSGRGEMIGWQLGVHIADVSHYVRPGSALDTEARRRGNSTYLADRVLPMLPERLSNGICSLKPGVERLTFSAFMEFDRQGRLKGSHFARSVIRSAARLSYRQAFALLQGRNEVPPLPPSLEKEARGLSTLAEGAPVRIAPEVAQAVREAWKLAEILRKRRFENGSLDLDFPEVKVWLDGQGKAVRLERVENDSSHQLIEECMLVANEAVARELKNRLIPTVYRIHEDPDPDRLQEFRELALQHRIKVGDLKQRREVQKTLAAIRGLPEEYALKLQFLKSLKRAAYSPKPLGHYGLAKVNYAHFTSPIRRYADLVVHRSLVHAETTASDQRPARRGKTVVTQAGMEAVSLHISETERVSADAEKESVMLKKLEYFQQQLTSPKPEQFRAHIVEVRPFGLIIELPDVLMSGLIHISSLTDDHYLFDAARMSFTGRRTKRRFKLGDQFQVIVGSVDLARRQVDFTPVKE